METDVTLCVNHCHYFDDSVGTKVSGKGAVPELTASPKEEEPYTYQTPVDVKLSDFCYEDLTGHKNLPTFFKLSPLCKKWLHKPGCCHIMM